MAIKSHIDIFCRLMLLATFFLSCRHGGEEEPYLTEEGLNLSFRLITADLSTSTRADDAGHEEAESELRILEDGIDMSDLHIFIFVKQADAEDASQTLIAHYGGDTGSSPISVITLSPGEHTVNFSIPKGTINEIVSPGSSAPPSSGRISLRAAVFANCKGALASIPDGTSLTFPDLIEALSNATVAMADMYDADAGDMAAALYGNKGSLPMFGSAEVTLTLSALLLSRPETAVMMGDIDLLRSVAKVRLVDNIRDKSEEGYPRIAAAEILSSQSETRILPYGAAEYVNGAQVHTANIHLPDTPLLSAEAFKYKVGLIADNVSMTPASMRTGDTRIAYLPEQKIDFADGNVLSGLPLFKITIAWGKNVAGNEVTEIYEVPMTRYPGFGTELLRNHIYTLSVNSVTPDEITVKARITPWIQERHHLSL